jgi:hydroxymethylpyrimidine kinase/phosphomethylpyrimidine kinase
VPVALTIAGSDSGGGAGIVADVRTLAAHGVWPAVAITAVTAQNTFGVHDVWLMDPAAVGAQIEAVVGDFAVGAVKTGMLGSAATVAAVGQALPGGVALVVDPVLVSTSGTALLDDPGALRALIARATVVTPNLAEAGVLTGRVVTSRDDMVAAARDLVGLGCSAALVTGGHLVGAPADCLVVGSAAPVWFSGTRVVGPGTHGSGCVLSAAVAARLALGDDVRAACEGAVAFVRAAIAGAVSLGGGEGAVNPR